VAVDQKVLGDPTTLGAVPTVAAAAGREVTPMPRKSLDGMWVGQLGIET